MYQKREDVSKEVLKQLIKVEGKSQREVSKLLNCSEAYISKQMKKFGMSKRVEDSYIGKRFGLLTPIRKIGSDGRGHVIFECFCECGATINVRGYCLKSGNTSTCGCKSRKRGKEHPNFKGYEEISRSYWWSVVNGAKNRNLDFNITIEDAWELFLNQGRRCALTGRKLIFAPVRKKISIQTASLDRIDSSKGYDLENVQWVHYQVNQMKWTLTQKEFINVCREVVEYN